MIAVLFLNIKTYVSLLFFCVFVSNSIFLYFLKEQLNYLSCQAFFFLIRECKNSHIRSFYLYFSKYTTEESLRGKQFYASNRDPRARPSFHSCWSQETGDLRLTFWWKRGSEHGRKHQEYKWLGTEKESSLTFYTQSHFYYLVHLTREGIR